MEKINVGILIFGDPTRGGTITSEVKFLKSLYEKNSETCNFFIIPINDSVTKRIIRDKNTIYDFPHKIIKAENTKNIQKLSCIVTYPGHSNFFGGYLNDNIVKMYKIVSECTNNLQIPVFIRINDSEIKVRDYRLMSKQRLDDGVNKPESAFMKDPINVKKAQDLVAVKEWDYNRVYWFANGSKEACDWVVETMFDREDESMRMASRETFIKNSIYVSDDIFFLIRKNYERFSHLKTSIQEKKICYIGFFDTVNMARAKALNILFKENRYKIPFKIFGKGTEILTKLQDKSNIEIEEGFIKGDSEEYFDFLNKHLAYIFIGKGQSTSRYIGKTVYDAVVARTPIIAYKKCDSNMIVFSNPEYYFETEKELADIIEKLQDENVRNKWIEDQAKEIFSKLPESNFAFSKYCYTNSDDFEIYEEIPSVKSTTPKPAKQVSSVSITTKSIPLF